MKRILALTAFLLPLSLSLTSCGPVSLGYDEGIETLEGYASAYQDEGFVRPSRYTYEEETESVKKTIRLSFQEGYRYQRIEDQGRISEEYHYLRREDEKLYIYAASVGEDGSKRCHQEEVFDEGQGFLNALEMEFSTNVLDFPSDLIEALKKDDTAFSIRGLNSFTVTCPRGTYEFENGLLSNYEEEAKKGRFYYGVAEVAYPVYDLTWSQE